MNIKTLNKKKIINDPVHGFVTIPSDFIYDLIEHPWFQRLRRIKQLGLTDLVYPGALHTRFHHAIGALHLMTTALNSLRAKNYEISDEEYEGAQIAILLHDIGHGPFSHVLENTILQKVHHESISALFLDELNIEYRGRLNLAIEIFKGSYRKKFLHQLVSSQLDIDRLDYLNRDAYFTGVVEGMVESERIIKMMEVVDDVLCIQEKGVYSIENFLNTRRLMYWQVYLHKTTIAAEEMLISVVKRAKALAQKGQVPNGSKALQIFLMNNIELSDFKKNSSLLDQFAQLDDYDIWSAIKSWVDHEDSILSVLSRMLIDRKLFKIIIQNEPFEPAFIKKVEDKIQEQYLISKENLAYLNLHGSISNLAYLSEEKSIYVVGKNQRLIDIAEASDLPNIKAISHSVTKYYLCRPFDVVVN